MSAEPQEFETLHEIVRAAHARLDGNIWEYVVGGTETETTLLRNRQSLDRIAFRPRVLRDVSAIDPSGRFLGRRIALPVALAPVGGLEAIGAEGGVSASRVAARYGVPYFQSSISQVPLERAAAVSDGPKVFQLYPRGDDEWIADYVKRAIDSEYDAFCITVDSAIYSRRERDIARRFSKPWRGKSLGMEFQAALDWDTIRRFKDRHRVPLILKGIGTAEDAELACEAGIEGIYVSNHGGRQLDHCLGAATVLEEVVEAVAGRAKVMVDGGFSRGSDVVKAIALGADLVGIGRLYCYGLGAAGEAGIQRVLELLEIEIVECLGLLGLTSFEGLDRSYVAKVDEVAPARIRGEFPLLEPLAAK